MEQATNHVITSQQITSIIQSLDSIVKQGGFSIGTYSVLMQNVIKPLTELPHIVLTQEETNVGP